VSVVDGAAAVLGWAIIYDLFASAVADGRPHACGHYRSIGRAIQTVASRASPALMSALAGFATSPGGLCSPVTGGRWLAPVPLVLNPSREKDTWPKIVSRGAGGRSLHGLSKSIRSRQQSGTRSTICCPKIGSRYRNLSWRSVTKWHESGYEDRGGRAASPTGVLGRRGLCSGPVEGETELKSKLPCARAVPGSARCRQSGSGAAA
jgi:hypothetical protein